MSMPSSPTWPLYRPPRWSQGLYFRYLLAAVGILTLLYYSTTPSYTIRGNTNTNIPTTGDRTNTKIPSNTYEQSSHPIDELIAKAETTFSDLLQHQSHDLQSAAAAYRARRGRHPPPGFDAWFNFAQENGAVIVEEFWDQIYHDLGPFWGVDPAQMRKEAATGEFSITVRDKKASTASGWFWTVIWNDLVSSIEHLLPDVDIPTNAMDEVRMAVPWEKINEHMELERKTRKMPAASHVIDENQSLPPQDEVEPNVEKIDPQWAETRPYWQAAVKGCHPDSIARKAEIMSDFNHTPTFSLGFTAPHTYRGYVSNHSLSADYCHQPDLQALHGSLINPITVSTTNKFFPIFAGSKLPTTNEILLPAPMYWDNNERFNGNEKPGLQWHQKQNKAIWRGVATGGTNNAKNWKGFQRHRFVSMTNSTFVTNAESWAQIPPNFALPPPSYNVAAQQESRLGEWVGEWADTGFVDLFCARVDPDVEESRNCSYVNPYFSMIEGQKLSQQYNNKYVPDVDGNSFSGRYRGFLMSSSLPIKATIYREWHDSRLVPWKHFVPMDNRFMDFYGIMQYFLGYEGENVRIQGHDTEAEKIAEDGQKWANKVLRKEDMQIYTMRLLLEYARLSDDKREVMGFVKDL